MSIQMIFCHSCGVKSQKQYLFLTCRHLSCLSCAFLKTDFATQELQCCGEITKIDGQSMETIIRSKRFVRQACENKQSKVVSPRQNSNNNKQLTDNEMLNEKKRKAYNFEQSYRQMKRDKENSKLQQKQQMSNLKRKQNSQRENQKDIVLADISNFSGKAQNSQMKKQVTEYREQFLQEDEFELGNLLIKHLQKVKKHFEYERKALKQRQQSALKCIIQRFQKQKKCVQRPITEAVLQKLDLRLSKTGQEAAVNRMETGDRTETGGDDKNVAESRESYDHILKRLELNQQRMKQKIQKHLEILY